MMLNLTFILTLTLIIFQTKYNYLIDWNVSTKLIFFLFLRGKFQLTDDKTQQCKPKVNKHTLFNLIFTQIQLPSCVILSNSPYILPLSLPIPAHVRITRSWELMKKGTPSREQQARQLWCEKSLYIINTRRV